MNFSRKLTGRCADGMERGQGSRYHAVQSDVAHWIPALCGAKPGRLTPGWDDASTSDVTCPRCIRKLAKAKS